MQPITFADECLLEFQCQLNSMLADSLIQVVREEGIELHSQQPPFCQQGSMLFYECEEAWQIFASLRHHNCLAEEKSALGATNVERIAERCEGREVYIVCRRSQSRSQPCPIDIYRDIAIGAYLVQLFEFATRI